MVRDVWDCSSGARAGCIEAWSNGPRESEEGASSVELPSRAQHAKSLSNPRICVANAGSYGTTAVASISTFASFSMSATTCTTLITGKCFPITAR